MRPIRVIGPAGEALPMDIYAPNPAFYVTMSGSGTLSITNDDPYSTTVTPIWSTVSPGSILYPVRAFRGTQAAATTVLTITQQGWLG